LGNAVVGIHALIALAAPATMLQAADWTALAGDAGMTRYSPDNIAGQVQVDYVKRFYSTFSNDPSPGNYYYSQSILIRDGVAAVFSSDSPPHIPGDNFGAGLPLTFFNLKTGQTTARTTTPSLSAWSSLPLPAGVKYTYPSGRYSLHLGESPQEIDSGHFTQSLVWGADGTLYARHGGDNAVTAAFAPATNTWTRLTPLKASPTLSNYNSFYEGDANGFLQVFGNSLLYRPGDTRQTSPYVAVNVSPSALSAGTAGTFISNIGPDIPAVASDDYTNGLRYGDIPKAATVNVNGTSTGVSVVAGLSVSSANFPYQYAVKVQATNLATGTSLWTKSFPSDNGGPNGFYTSTPDYWRFLASADGTYVLYSGTTTRTLEAIDMATGAQKWSHALPAGSTEPLMAANGNSLYVIGDTAQMAMNIDTGAVVWSTKNSTRAEATSFMSGEDPINHPLVLTSGTAWYLDGGTSVAGEQSLVGIDTATGKIIQQIDLTALVAKKPGESLLAVNDIAAANGELAVLLGIRSTADPYPTAAPGSSNGIIYQDLYVFTAVPEPTGVLPLGAGAMLFCRRRRNG
jgi:hypothetical protein